MKKFRLIRTGSTMALLMLTFAAQQTFAQAWIVPDDQKGEMATFKFTEEVVDKGAAIFTKNCQSCHGIPTKANWAKIVPEPGDPATEKFSKNSDGELFYKISNGRGPMPQFKNILSEEERWTVIAYVRSFHKGYRQPDPELAKAKAKGGHSSITMKYDSVTGKLILQVINTKDKVTVPAARAGILVFVKRYFGLLQVGEVKTNDKGYAAFDFPKELPGDSAGVIAVVARLNEDSGYGSAEKMDSLPVGTRVKWVSLTDQRAMWNVRSKAPVWLVLSYLLVLLGVIITLVYILLQVRKIHHTGRTVNINNTP